MSQETRAAVAILAYVACRECLLLALVTGSDDVPGMRRQRSCGKLPIEFDAIGELAVYDCTTGRRIVPGGTAGRISGAGNDGAVTGSASLRSILTEASIPVQQRIRHDDRRPQRPECDH